MALINTGALIYFLRERLGEDLLRAQGRGARARIEAKLKIVADFEQLHHNEDRMKDPLLQARHSMLLHGDMLRLAQPYAAHEKFDKRWKL